VGGSFSTGTPWWLEQVECGKNVTFLIGSMTYRFFSEAMGDIKKRPVQLT